MKKFFKYLFILTIMFILPNFVLADETDTTFDHIDINKSVSLKYTVSGNDKIYTKTLDSLADVKLYIVDKDNSNVRTPIDLSGATATDGTYRINGNFNKLYEGTDTFVKYLVEYTFNDQDIYTDLNSNTNKSITYSKEYSFNSEHNKSTDGGILIDLQETNSIQNIPTMLTIKKELENNNTPPGTFTFNIKNASGTIIKTVNITIPEGSTSKEIYFESININTTYLVEEVPDSQNIYKLLSIESTKGDPTIAHDSNATTVRATSTSDTITVTAKNGSAVDHNKEATPNGDGTYQLSLDVTGQNIKDPANKANVVVIFDTSGSMKASTGSGKYTYRYTSVNWDSWSTQFYGLVNGEYVELTRSKYDYNYYYRTGNNWTRYRGQRFTRERVAETRLIAGQEAIKSLAGSLLNNNNLEDDDPNNDDIVLMSLVTFNTTASNPTTPTNTFSTIETAVNATTANGGTNWEDALQKAMSVNFGANREATTYYIFVSDGNPTFRNTKGNYGYLPVTDNTQWYSTDYWGIHSNNTYETYKNDNYFYNSAGVYGLGMDSQYNDNNKPVGNYSPTSMTHCYDEAKDEAKSIVDNHVVLYTIGAYGNVARMKNLTNYAYTGNDNTAPQGTYYYDATDTEQLNQALKDILAAIERSGIGAVTISDGTTQSITTSAGVSHLLTVDKSSYEYWLTFNLSDDNKIMVNDTEVTVTKNGDNYTLSWTEGETSKSITAPAGSSIKGNTFVYKWTGANDFYKVDPPQAKLESGSVNWVLSKEKVGLLLNDVKYTVTFNVWPSQTTYDLISDLDNNIKKYGDLDPEIKKYLIKNSDGSYSLKTNTTAKLTYDDSRDQVGSRDTYFVNPEPVATGVSEVTLVKEWENDLDDREADEIELYLTVDDKDYGPKDEGGKILPYVLRKTDDPNTNWRTQVFISTGLISLDRTTGTAIVREVGHEYGFREKPSDAYYWDLEVAIRRPMVINKAKTEDSEEVELETVMLIKLTNEEKSKLTTADINTLDTKNYLVKEGIEYFRICYRDEDGKDIPNSCNIYRRATTAESNTISATNYRRSNLNVTKAVDGDYDPDTLFTFSLQVTDANGHDVWFSIWNGTGYVINDANHNYVTDATAEVLVESDTIHNIVYDPSTGKVTYIENGEEKEITYIGEDNDGNPFTGFYFFRSGNTITVLMKAGWNLRFTNLPNGSTYTFVENLSSAYSLEKVELNKYRKKDGAATPEINEDITLPKSTTVTGEIDEHNLSYTVTYTNEAVKADPVTASKIWEGDNENIRPQSIKLNLLADGKLKDTVTINGTSSTWNYTWNNLAMYNAAGGEIVYTVTETAVNEGDLDSYIPVISSNGLTITNYYNLRDITVTKAWGANAKQATVVVRLTSDRGYDDSKPLNNPSWTYTWTDLPIYYLDINGNRQSIIYSVSEISVNNITLENGIAYDYDTYIHSTIGKWILVSIASNANGFTVTNDYKKYDSSLSFKKMSFTDYNDGKTNGLAGAKFRLYKYIGEGVSLDTDDPLTNSDNWIVIDELTSDANGMMVFNKIYKDGELYLDGLYEGEYRLVEIEAPKGYVLCGGQWRLFIDLNKNTDVVSLRKFDKSTSVGRTTGLTFDDDNNIVVLNEEIPEIPTTGGIGIPHYDKYGLLLMLLSIAIFLFNIINQRKQIENI